MLEAHHYSSSAQRKGSYVLPDEFDGTVHKVALYHAIRAIRNHNRQGTAATKTRAEVSGGGRKPWRQKGTGRARQGTIRAPQWVGGGVVFGPSPRRYNTKLPRKVRTLARRSAFNARAKDGALHVIESFALEEPKTRQFVELLAKLGLADQKVLVLTAENRPAVVLSSRNLPKAHVMRFADASAYDVLWADALLIEESAIGGHAIAGKRAAVGREKRAKKATTATAAKKRAKAAKKKTTKKTSKTAKKATKKSSKTTKKTTTKKKR